MPRMRTARCTETDPTGNACTLAADHDGPHVVVPKRRLYPSQLGRVGSAAETALATIRAALADCASGCASYTSNVRALQVAGLALADALGEDLAPPAEEEAGHV